MDKGLRKDWYEKRQVKTREPDRFHLSASAPRSPRPWVRTTITKATSPMGEDDQHHGHLAHGRGRPVPRSPRRWVRTISTTVTSPMGEDDQHRGHLAHKRGRSAPGSPALGRGQSHPGQSDSF
ncbi:hypothetical protein F2Q70_00043326 [Brassica cretica]|uniref:Uncharacterized protein n=1 Tax=Brassica cretica TaxID=69181 RepID=A0A8S9KGH0_BRACR|nr:hypothetical protein F2Q68_00004878 [Brassica cretica]KAF2592523.1 hypothetical protein F2Q70_00043326 [Brassica cretica]